MPTTDTYYNMLVQHPNLAYAYDFTTALSCASVKDQGSGQRPPTEFDSINESLLQWTDPSQGIMNATQKWPNVKTYDKPSFFFTWEFMVGAGCRRVSAGYLSIIKAWRFDSPKGAFYLAAKLDFGSAKKNGPPESVAEFQITSQTKAYLGPGTTRLGEVLLPRAGRMFCLPNQWYRAYVYLDGHIGDGSLNKLSVWVADNQQVTQLLDRLGLYAAPNGLEVFRLEYNTSATTALNPKMEFWNRHLVVLHGVPRGDVPPLLRPV